MWSFVLIIVTNMINNDFVAKAYISLLLLFDFIIFASFTFISRPCHASPPLFSVFYFIYIYIYNETVMFLLTKKTTKMQGRTTKP